MIGTGPFKFVSFRRGDRIELAQTTATGGRAAWEKVIFRMLSSDPTRVAALLAGDVDAIENIPTADLAKIRKNPSFLSSEKVSHRVIFFHVDQFREQTRSSPTRPASRSTEEPAEGPARAPGDFEGDQPPGDRRPRHGRPARATGQLMPEGMFGYTPALKPEPFDPEGREEAARRGRLSRRLRADAARPQRPLRQRRPDLQALAQMLTRIGIDASRNDAVVGYFSRANKLEFSLMLVGWGSDTAEASSPLKALLATFSNEKGMGQANRGRYSNPKMDALLEQALATVDDAKREKLLQQATEIAMTDLGIIPLHHQVNLWATRKGIVYAPRTDERTLAHEFRQKMERREASRLFPENPRTTLPVKARFPPPSPPHSDWCSSADSKRARAARARRRRIGADLTIALSADITSLDPHYVAAQPNINIGWHVFDALTRVDERARLMPGIAESWRAVNPTTWEFKLHKGVKFHDGSELTTEDVAFSLERPLTITGSPGGFAVYVRPIVAREIVDRYTIRLKTAAPYGALPQDLNSILIVSGKPRQTQPRRISTADAP